VEQALSSATLHVLDLQLHFTARFQNSTTGLYFHGYNAATGVPSCCAWSRANGWQMMSVVETILAVVAVIPSSPLLPQLLAALKSHADALIAVQSTDGRWHQVN
jgi:rhamnogalacturonyl hydrolase YesR